MIEGRYKAESLHISNLFLFWRLIRFNLKIPFTENVNGIFLTCYLDFCFNLFLHFVVWNVLARRLGILLLLLLARLLR